MTFLLDNYTSQFNFCHLFRHLYSASISLKICATANRVDFDGQYTLKNIYIREISRADCFCAMIDWVSIVRHSRRRFSDYMFAVPIKIRKRQRARRHTNPKLVLLYDHDVNNAISHNSQNSGDGCECCWSHVSSEQNFASVPKKMFFLQPNKCEEN